MIRVVASIEARMGSSRLPGKVLADIGGVPALTRMVRRVRRCELVDEIVVATSTSPLDDEIERWAGAEGVSVYRGSEDDVLARVVEAHQSIESDVVVELTGDCILTDPEVVDLAVDTYLANDCDIVATGARRSFPLGIAVEVFSLAALATVAATVFDPNVREHVSLHFFDHPELYRTIHVRAPRRWREPDWRLHLDYPEDLRFLREVYRRLEPSHGDDFGLDDIARLLRLEPALVELNRGCVERSAR